MTDPQYTDSSPTEAILGMSRYVASEKLAMLTPATYAQMRYVPALIITGPMASPSSPSVRFTAFEVATTTNSANGTYTQIGSTIWCLENATKGSARCVLIAIQSAGSRELARN